MTEIKLPPLPEPDWYLVMSTDGGNVNVELRASDEDAVNAALDMGGMVEIHRLITIDKAEAKVREALEAALENARELCAEKAELERIIGQQAETIRAQMAERDALKEAVETIADYPYHRDNEMAASAMMKIARAALAQEQEQE